MNQKTADPVSQFQIRGRGNLIILVQFLGLLTLDYTALISYWQENRWTEDRHALWSASTAGDVGRLSSSKC